MSRPETISILVVVTTTPHHLLLLLQKISSYAGGAGYTLAADSPTNGDRDMFSMNMNSGSSGHRLDNELIPGLEKLLQIYRKLHQLQVITTAGRHTQSL